MSAPGEGRTPMDAMLDGLEWTALPRDNEEPWDGVLPYATHEGVLRMPGCPPLRVYQLSDGSRVIDAADLETFFGADHADAS